MLIFQQEVTSGSQDSAGGGPGALAPPHEAGEERQQVKTGGAGPTPLRPGAPHPGPQLLQLLPVRPSLSLSVSTAPASALLLCDRLTPACPQGRITCPRRTRLCPWQGPAGITSRRMQIAHTGPLRPVDSWPPPSVSPPGQTLRGPQASSGDKGAADDGWPPRIPLGGRVRGVNYPELFAPNYPPKGPGEPGNAHPSLLPLASGFLFSEPGGLLAQAW